MNRIRRLARPTPRRLILLVCLVGLAVLIASASSGNKSSSAKSKFVAVPAAGNLTALTAANAQPFSGQVTETSCGSSGVTADPSSTIDIAVTAQVPTNDIMVNLIYGGNVVHNEDTGVGQETFIYAVDANSGGTYTIQVCKSGAPATPFLPAGGPYPYDGTYTDIDVTTPTLPIPPPGSTTNPVTVTPVASYASWNAKFSPATVVDPQRTEGEPIVITDGDGNIWESGPWGFTTAQSFMHRSTTDGREFHIVSATALREGSQARNNHAHKARPYRGGSLLRRRGIGVRSVGASAPAIFPAYAISAIRRSRHHKDRAGQRIRPRRSRPSRDRPHEKRFRST